MTARWIPARLPILVGEAPSRRPVPWVLYSQLLGELAGVEPEWFRDRTMRINLLPRWPGRSRKDGLAGDHWPRAWARKEAREKLRSLAAFPTVVLLGKRVASAFEIRVEFFRPIPVADATWFVVPHFSGASRWWNDPDHYDAARAFWRGFRRRVEGEKE